MEIALATLKLVYEKNKQTKKHRLVRAKRPERSYLSAEILAFPYGCV